jgi:hypothetical protein
MNKIGGSNRVREELTAALAEGRGVTAKVKWVTRMDEEGQGRNKWIHCTPLVGSNGNIGVWMIVIVDDEKNNGRYGTGGRQAPPVAATPERSYTPNRGSSDQRNDVHREGGSTTARSVAGSVNSFQI